MFFYILYVLISLKKEIHLLINSKSPVIIQIHPIGIGTGGKVYGQVLVIHHIMG